jgi:hypothetical protein
MFPFRNQIQKTLRRLAWSWARLRQWRRDQSPVWRWSAVFIGPAIIILLSHREIGYPGSRENALHLWGLVLQTIGLFKIALDVDAAVTKLGGEPFCAPVRRFFTGFFDIFRGPKTVSLTASSSVHFSGGGTFAPHVLVSAAGTVEERLAQLETGFRRLTEDELPKRWLNIDAKHNELGNRIEKEARDREANHQVALRHRWETAKLQINFGGFAYLVLGTIAASVPLPLMLQ